MKKLSIALMALLYSVEAINLKQFHRNQGDDIDEDEELNPNAIDDGNVAVFSQTFLNEGKGVQKLKQEMESMKKAKLDREGMEFAHEYSQPAEIKNIAKQVEKKT